MVKKGIDYTEHEKLAERCRLALEKSYGIQIPVPKCIEKSHMLNK